MYFTYSQAGGLREQFSITETYELTNITMRQAFKLW